jgi:DNA-directed RNA polymerase specialized sigma24 family protein
MNRPHWVQDNGWNDLGQPIPAGTHARGGDTSQTGDNEVERLIARGEYRSALEALVRAYQDLIVRHCTAMLGDAGQGEEVAHILGRSEAGVRRQLARTLAQLRRLLEAAS